MAQRWPQRSFSLWRMLAAGISLGLVAAAMVLAVGHVDWASLAMLPAWLWCVLGLLVLLNVALTGLMFWVVTLSFDAQPPVGAGLMVRLIAASSLFNYLPLRAGLVGRAALLKVHHALPLRQSMLILIAVLATGGITTLVMGGAALLIPSSWLMTMTAGLLLAGMTALTPWMARRLLRRRVMMAQWWVPLRVLDMLVAAARLWLVFWAMGHPLTFQQAIAAAAAGLLMTMASFTPNGLGLREWVIALIAQSLGAASLEAGLAATLIDRGVEVVVIAITGSLATLSLQPWIAPSRQAAATGAVEAEDESGSRGKSS